MTANVIVMVERQFDYPRPEVFRAWTAPARDGRSGAAPRAGTSRRRRVSAELSSVASTHHVKVRDSDPSTR